MRKIMMLILCVYAACLVATPTDYISGKNETEAYRKLNLSTSHDLMFRDLDPWLQKVKGKQALDYGCGLGVSAQYLLTKGYKVDAVDISPSMLTEAKTKLPQVNFFLMQEDILPFKNKKFDLVFSSLVLFEISSLKKIQQYLQEAKRVMKDDGYIIAITGSSHMHNPDLQSPFRTADFPENRKAKSGDLIRVTLKDINLTFTDYLWFEHDYRQVFADSGLEVCAVHYPLGRKDDNIPWGYELHSSPFILILAAKTCNLG